MAQSILNMDGWMLLHPQYPQSGAHPQWWIAPAVPGGVHDTLASRLGLVGEGGAGVFVLLFVANNHDLSLTLTCWIIPLALGLGSVGMEMM